MGGDDDMDRMDAVLSGGEGGQDAGAPSGERAAEMCVPTSALTEASEGGQESVAPEKGDRVAFQVEGTVTRSENGMTYVVPETANGEAMPAAGGEDPNSKLKGQTGGDEGMALREAMENLQGGGM